MAKANSKPMNKGLGAAKAAKKDEFYTQYIDIQKEVEAFAEDEGLSLILPKSEADRLGLSYETPMKQITLMVFSSLEGVGLTFARLQGRVGQEGIELARRRFVLRDQELACRIRELLEVFDTVLRLGIAAAPEMLEQP